MEQDNGRENFKIGLDTEQLDRDAQGARAAFESLGAAAEGVGKQIDQSLGKTDASALRKEMAETEKAIKDVQECIAANSREVEEFKSKIQAAQAQLAYGGDKDTLTAQVQGYRDTIAQLTNGSKSLTSEHSNLQASLARMSEQWAQLSVEAQQAAIAEQEAAEASNAVTHASATANISEGAATNANTGAIAAKAVAESKAAEATAQAAAATQQSAQTQEQQAEKVNCATQSLEEQTRAVQQQSTAFLELLESVSSVIKQIENGNVSEEEYSQTLQRVRDNTEDVAQSIISLNSSLSQAKDAREAAMNSGDENAVERYNQRIEELNNRLDSASEKHRELKDAESDLLNTMGMAQAATQWTAEMNARLDELKVEIYSFGQGLKEIEENSAFQKQAERAEHLAEALVKDEELLQRGLISQEAVDATRDAYEKQLDRLSGTVGLITDAAQEQKKLGSETDNTAKKIDEAGNAHTRAAEKAKAYKKEAEKIPTVHNQIADTMKTIGQMTAGYFTVKGIEGFIQKCIEVRKNLELMEVRFQGLMGDAGTELLGDIKQMAMDSGVYTTKALSEVAQTLNVYGIETEQIMPLLREFGDVAMGNEQKLSSLAMAFGRLETQGQLSSLTLRTFTRTGFNPLEEMARKTGKSMQQLRTEMSAGLITTQKVKDALKSATSQGGKFYNMTENISGSIAAEQGRLQQMITKIYAEWGKSHEDMIKGGYQFAQALVANYETIGKAIATLISVYGTYRASLMVNTVLESTRVAALARLIRMQGLATVAQHALNAACKANPYVLLATVVLSLGAALVIWTNKSDAAAKAQQRAKEITDQTKASTERFNQSVDNLMGTLHDSTASTYEHANALKELKKKFPNILKDVNTYNDYLREQARIEAQIAQSKAYQPVSNAKKNLDVAKQDLEAAKAEMAKAKSAYDVAASLDDEDGAAEKAASVALQLAKDKVAAAQKVVNQFQAAYNSAKKEYDTLVAQAGKDANVKNKKYWEQKQQAARAKKDAMDISQKGSKEWTEAENEFLEASEKLQAYEMKTAKQRDAAAAKAEKEEERKRKAEERQLKAEERQENLELDGKKKAAEALRNWTEKQAEMEAEAEWNRRQAVIDAMEEGSQKQLEQLRLNHDKEIAEIDREAKEMWKARIEYQKTVFESKPKNKHKDFYQSDVYKALLPEDEKHPLTKDEEDKLGLTAKRESSDAKYNREQRTILEAEQQAMQDYIKQYGTLQEQKLALDREYAEKRRKIMESSDTDKQKQWQLANLKREQENAISKMSLDILKKSMNWEGVFSSLDDFSLEFLRDLRIQIRKAIDTKDLLPDQAKELTDAIDSIDEKITEKQKAWRNNFGLVIPELEKINNLEREIAKAEQAKADAEKEHETALRNVLNTQLEIAQLLNDNGIEVSPYNISSSNSQQFISQLGSKGGNTQLLFNLFDKLGGQEQQLTTSTQNLSGATSQLSTSMGKAAGGTASTVAIIDAIIKGINKNVQSAKELIEQMDEADSRFGQGFMSFAESSQYATSAWNSLKEGDFMGVANGVYGSLRTLGDALGKWGVKGFGTSDKSYEEDMERLRQSNTDLAYAIDSLAEIMADQAGAEATATYEAQKADLEQREKNLQEDIQRSGNKSSKGFLGIGSKGSTRHYIDENMSASDWEKVSQAAGVSVKSASDFFSLTSEQMHNVATYASAEWTKIMLHAEDGMESIKDQLNEYVNIQSEADDALKNYQETLTSLSFDSLKGSMAELLERSETDTEDVIDNINKYLQKAIINTVLTKAGQDRLEAWYTSFAEAMSDGVMTATESAALRTSYAQIYDDVNKQYEAAMQAAGLDPEDFDDEDSGDSGSWESLGEETGRALEGRFAALQIQTTKIADIVAAQYEANTQGNTQRITALSEMNNLVFICSEHLERIASNTDALPRMEKKLETIKTNTDRL